MRQGAVLGAFVQYEDERLDIRKERLTARAAHARGKDESERVGRAGEWQHGRACCVPAHLGTHDELVPPRDSLSPLVPEFSR